ncbi:MAG: hypothetical protein FRX49_08338 [Trebouxia sp. A1-2]|nr:MAG: hypothetical protein FRX49_08338 [Trebouxia sp. A1-2]
MLVNTFVTDRDRQQCLPWIDGHRLGSIVGLVDAHKPVNQEPKGTEGKRHKAGEHASEKGSRESTSSSSASPPRVIIWACLGTLGGKVVGKIGGKAVGKIVGKRDKCHDAESSGSFSACPTKPAAFFFSLASSASAALDSFFRAVSLAVSSGFICVVTKHHFLHCLINTSRKEKQMKDTNALRWFNVDKLVQAYNTRITEPNSFPAAAWVSTEARAALPRHILPPLGLPPPPLMVQGIKSIASTVFALDSMRKVATPKPLRLSISTQHWAVPVLSTTTYSKAPQLVDTAISYLASITPRSPAFQWTGSQLAPNLLQSLGVLLHFPPDPFLKLLQNLLLSLQLLFQLLGFSGQLWDSSLKLLSLCAAFLQEHTSSGVSLSRYMVQQQQDRQQVVAGSLFTMHT